MTAEDLDAELDAYHEVVSKLSLNFLQLLLSSCNNQHQFYFGSE